MSRDKILQKFKEELELIKKEFLFLYNEAKNSKIKFIGEPHGKIKEINREGNNRVGGKNFSHVPENEDENGEKQDGEKN